MSDVSSEQNVLQLQSAATTIWNYPVRRLLQQKQQAGHLAALGLVASSDHISDLKVLLATTT
jgi:hypothetical protein